LSVEDPVDHYGKRVFIGVHGPLTKAATVLDSQARKAIAYLLAVRGPLTLKEISDNLRLSPSTVYDHLKRLKEVGVVKEAEEHPKKFKVEVYYRLNIPYLLFSELKRTEETMNSLLRDFFAFIEKTKSNMTINIKNLNFRCLTYKDPSLYDRVILVLIAQLFILAFSKFVKEPLTYIIINDLEESDVSVS